MENISPSLLLLWDVKRSLAKGHSVAQGVRQFLLRDDVGSKDSDFIVCVEQWWVSQNNPSFLFNKTSLSLHRQYLLELLEAGLRGQSISAALNNLESELILSCEGEMQERLMRLPLLSLLPLLFLIFPSLMIVLISPLLEAFTI
ncbi:hypothetical protein [Pseudobdellovibrio exovorus]|uniref:Type II secretion system protein GspF domain-containing protein n=1 Tax=Pseudobdellovibrio exovorus JSS TaxID=1184267 RepID=M4VBE5_9BACT|nr:hypothetical protein [Pseudobdellovibrio exovorus]AGH96717.1 hypothetical protein A11Q_2501 [Pseudobdellovibrio exovorus JSS]